MAIGRTRLSLETDQLSGPFITASAVSEVGWEQMMYLNKSGSIFWYGHSKQYYCAYQEIRKTHTVNAPWYYEVANPLDECSAQYGRIRIYKYDRFVILIDSFTRELYTNTTLADAFETAVMIAHYFPDERVVPNVELGYKAVLPKMMPTQADFDPSAPYGDLRFYDDNKMRIALDRQVTIGLGDAISIITGDRPSNAFLAHLSSTFPQALIAAYGPSLITYCRDTTAIAVAQSISSLSEVEGVELDAAIESYADAHKVGRYSIVGGWGHKILQEYGADTTAIAMVDLALTHAGSPEVARAMIADLNG